ncbi:MAG: N-acyl-D-amino-acid deacylase family protein, partial [Candidatus Acidiferrales bacterium]
MPRALTRRRFLREGGAAALGLALASGWRVEAAPAFDLVLKGGTLLDGTGAPAWLGDIGLVGDTIAALGSIAPEQGRRVLDVSGLHVAPGFIDIHSHSDFSLLAYPGAESRILQGITTEITGNCGSSAAPIAGLGAQAARRGFLSDTGVEPGWSDVASYFDLLEKTGIALNQALLLGQGTLRQNAIGLVDRPLTPDELAGVLRAVEEGLDHGAVGLSTGLEYTPGMYTPTEEIVAMARIVARRGGLYASHIRNEEAMLLEAVNEAIEIGRRAGLRVEISHLKAAGEPNWSKQRGALDLIASARRDGVNVLADAYPYVAYSTGLSIFLRGWAREGGSPAYLQRLRDPDTRARIRREAVEYIRNEPGGYHLIQISNVRTQKNKPVVGKTMEEIATEWKMEPVDALLRLLEEEEGNVSFIGFGMSPENVELVLSHPLVMIGSDGYSLAPTGRAAESRPHPRSYGAYSRVLHHFVRDRRLFDLPTAVKKMTSMVADQIGLSDRGRLARGQKADLVVFDAAGLEDRASFADPHQYP